MTFEEALVSELKVIPQLQNRIYPLASPEAKAKNGVPYLIYGSSEGVRTKMLGNGYQSGRSVSAEINIMSYRYEELKATTRQAIDVLISMEKRVIGTGGPFIQEVTYEPPRESFEDAPKLYRCLIDCNVYYEG